MSNLDSNLSTSGGDAPAPDSAATSTPEVAAPSSAAASTEDVAASTTTGADAAPATLDSLFEKFKGQSEQESGAGKPEETEQSQTPKPEEKPEEVEQEEAAPAEEDADPLAEFESRLPTRESINEKYARAPKAIRDEFAETAEKLTAREAERQEIGGDEGVQIAREILPRLLSPKTTEGDVNAVFEAMVEANPPLVAQMGSAFINAALNDERTGEAFGSQLLESELGEGYNLAKLRSLVEADQMGLIDHEAVEEGRQMARTPTEREQQLEAENKRLTETVQKYEGKTTDATAKEEQRLNDLVDSFVTDEAMDEVLPIVRKLGWIPGDDEKGDPLNAAKVLHGEMVTAYLNAKVKASNEYTTIQALKEEGRAFKNGQPTLQMRKAVNSLRTRAKAVMLQAGRTLGTTYASSFTRTRTATSQPSTTTSRSGDTPTTPATPAQQQPQSSQQPQLSTQEKLDALAARYKSAASEAEIAVGRR